jgi:hypothetical protein
MHIKRSLVVQQAQDDELLAAQRVFSDAISYPVFQLEHINHTSEIPTLKHSYSYTGTQPPSDAPSNLSSDIEQRDRLSPVAPF